MSEFHFHRSKKDEMEIWYYWIVCQIQDLASWRELSTVKKLPIGEKAKSTSWQNVQTIITVENIKRLLSPLTS